MTTPQVQGMTPPQVDEMIPTQVQELIPTQMEELTAPQLEGMPTPQLDEAARQILENWFLAQKVAAELVSLLLLVVATFYDEDAEIQISIYLWICFALVYAWLFKNRILSVYVSYQHKAPLCYSLLSAAACFLTCLIAFCYYRQSQNLTIFNFLQLCLSAILGSMMETMLHYKLRVNGVTRNG